MNAPLSVAPLRLRGLDPAEPGHDALQAQMDALLANPRLLMSTPSPIRAPLWLMLLRPTSEGMVAKLSSAHPLLAFAEELVRAALNGHRRAFIPLRIATGGTRG